MSRPWDIDPGRESLPLAWSTVSHSDTDERTRQRLALLLECDRCAMLTAAAWRNGFTATVRCGGGCWHGHPPAAPSGSLRRALSALQVAPEPRNREDAA